MNNSIKTQFGKIKVDEVRKSNFGKADIAIIRQKIKTTYPGSKSGNSFTDSLFNDNEFGEGKSYVSSRVTFLKVPKGTTEEEVQKKLDNYPDARIYRIMSLDYKNVMTDEQKIAIDQGISNKTYEEYEASLRAKNPSTNEDLMYNGKVFYRATYFSTTNVEDIDLRDEEYNNFTVRTEQSERKRIQLSPSQTTIKQIETAFDEF
jgi:hypothetical protein